MDRPNPQSTNSRDAALRTLTDTIERRIETTLGDWFEIEAITSNRERSGACGAGVNFAAFVGETGRLETFEVAPSDLRRPGWRVASVADRASTYPGAYRAALESRVVAVTLGTACRDRSDVPNLDGMAFPELEVGVAEQLVALGARVAAAGRGGAVDWAIERVVAEAYRLELSELVALQEEFSEQKVR